MLGLLVVFSVSFIISKGLWLLAWVWVGLGWVRFLISTLSFRGFIQGFFLLAISLAFFFVLCLVRYFAFLLFLFVVVRRYIGWLVGR